MVGDEIELEMESEICTIEQVKQELHSECFPETLIPPT